MIDFAYMNCIADLIADAELTEKIFWLRFEAFRKLRRIATVYEEDGFKAELVEAVFGKKAKYLMEATTKKETASILKPSTPRYSGGEFYPKGDYYVEEEELILWSRTSYLRPLTLEEQKRYQELFGHYFGNEAA